MAASDRDLRLDWLPANKSFAVAFVDDADGSHYGGVRLVYDFMTSLGLRATRTVWPLRAVSSTGTRANIHEADHTLQDRQYREYCERLKTLGHELAMHGASSGNNTRDRVIAAYDLFERVFGEPPAVNVMHGRNFENIYWGRSHFDGWTGRLVGLHEPQSFYGHVPGSPYFWGDVCREKTRYVRFHETLGADVGSFDPATPYHDPSKPFVNWWFSAAYGAGDRVLDLLSPSSLAALRQRRSFSIIHCYSAHHVAPDTSGRLAIEPRFAAALERLAAMDDAWVVPVSTLLDRIRAARDHVDVEIEPDRLRLLAGTLQRTAWKYQRRFDAESTAPLARGWKVVRTAVAYQRSAVPKKDIWSGIAAAANDPGKSMIASQAADHLWGPPTALALECLGDLSGKSVVELGCGRGEMSVAFAIMGARVQAFDIDAQRLEAARSLAARCGVAERCDFAICRSESVPLPDRCADLVFSRTALQYTDREVVLGQCRRLLVPDGQLVLIENMPANPFVLGYRLVRRLRARTAARRAYVDSIKGYLRLDEIAALHGPFDELDVRVFHLAAPLTALAPRDRWRRLKATLGWVDELLLQRFPRLRAAGWIVVVVARRAG